MYPQVSFKNKIDETHYEEWGFILIDLNIYLDTYVLFKKEDGSKRKYFPVKKYERIVSGVKRSFVGKIDENEVPLSDEIKEEALNALFCNVKVLKWGERFSK
jgi:hypothetical protein